jgi:nucleotide-binding universal stress UspA family protein
MDQSFKTILVPVDFSINTEVAVRKALEVIDKFRGTIHLMHVTPQMKSNLITVVKKSYRDEPKLPAEQLLLEWKRTIKDSIPTINVGISLEHHSSIQMSIEKKALQLKADLVVVGKKSNHFWLPFLNTVLPNELCEVTGSAVLTVKPGSLHNKIRTLVVPITTEVPRSKMDAIAALSRKTSLKVYLVTFSNENNIPADFSASALLKVYQWLKESIHCQVEYSVLHGSNKAKALMLFAEKINADVLLLDTSSETRVGWMNRHISDILEPGSKVQVLALNRTNY